jgi:hypothetical protein
MKMKAKMAENENNRNNRNVKMKWRQRIEWQRAANESISVAVMGNGVGMAGSSIVVAA